MHFKNAVSHRANGLKSAGQSSLHWQLTLHREPAKNCRCFSGCAPPHLLDNTTGARLLRKPQGAPLRWYAPPLRGLSSL
jgi:hypothetical protein